MARSKRIAKGGGGGEIPIPFKGSEPPRARKRMSGGGGGGELPFPFGLTGGAITSASLFQQTVAINIALPETGGLASAANLPGRPGATVTLNFISVSISVQSGQAVNVRLEAPGASADDFIAIPLASQGTFGGSQLFVAAQPIAFTYTLPRSGTTAPTFQQRIIVAATKVNCIQNAQAFFLGTTSA